jgi:hypothetical protein
MIEQDRVLLARIADLTQSIGQGVLMLLGEGLAEGQPPAEGLRALAEQFDAVSWELRHRAEQLDNTLDAIEDPGAGK